MIYRFKVRFEEEEDFERWIDIKTNATFLQFHNAIQDTLKFNKKEDASFYVSNDNWKKLKEIAIPAIMNESKTDNSPVIAAFINEPYQKFVYVADHNMEWTLEVELSKIMDETKGVKYPFIAKSFGHPPRQNGLQISDAELAEDMVKNDVGIAESDDLTSPNIGNLPRTETEDSINLDDFPDLDDIDGLDFSDED
mgnify:CR=1 FL=1